MNVGGFKLKAHFGQDEKKREWRYVGRAERASRRRQVVNEAHNQTFSDRVRAERF